MKIVKNTREVQAVVKKETHVGELYLVEGGEGVHFRCQGGFVTMSSGSFMDYEKCREDACYVHLPDAELHLNN
jgi:hypothetical protein